MGSLQLPGATICPIYTDQLIIFWNPSNTGPGAWRVLLPGEWYDNLRLLGIIRSCLGVAVQQQKTNRSESLEKCLLESILSSYIIKYWKNLCGKWENPIFVAHNGRLIALRLSQVVPSRFSPENVSLHRCFYVGSCNASRGWRNDLNKSPKHIIFSSHYHRNKT